MNIKELIIKRSELLPKDIADGKDDLLFDEILRAMRDVHRGKENIYGNYLETHDDEEIATRLLQHFFDVKRKYIRASNFLAKNPMNLDKIDCTQLLDTYMDLAIYSVMGVQLLLHLGNDYEAFNFEEVCPTSINHKSSGKEIAHYITYAIKGKVPYEQEMAINNQLQEWLGLESKNGEV